MQFSPEIVRAEIEYRQRAARSVSAETLRAARRANPPWWRRLRRRHE